MPRARAKKKKKRSGERAEGARTCVGSFVFKRTTSLASSNAVDPHRVAAAAASRVIVRTGLMTRAHCTPCDSLTVTAGPLPGRLAAALAALDSNVAPKSSTRTTDPPVASARGASLAAPMASRPPEMMSTVTSSEAICGSIERRRGRESAGSIQRLWFRRDREKKNSRRGFCYQSGCN